MVIFLSITLSNCSDEAEIIPRKEIDKVPYSFYAAGHLYGAIGVNYQGIHPPFKKRINDINADTTIKFGFFLGDFVKSGTIQEWEYFNKDIDLLNDPVHLVFGNHDYKNEAYINENFDETYYTFNHNNDLHIILDGNIDGWSIEGEQLEFLKETLDEETLSFDNIFVYAHQALWVGNSDLQPALNLNSTEGRQQNPNFWSEVEPMLSELGIPVYLFSGDLGSPWSDDCYHKLYRNIHYIATGMGDGKGDNYLEIDVLSDGDVIVNLISIDGSDPSALGSFTDYCSK